MVIVGGHQLDDFYRSASPQRNDLSKGSEIDIYRSDFLGLCGTSRGSLHAAVLEQSVAVAPHGSSLAGGTRMAAPVGGATPDVSPHR